MTEPAAAPVTPSLKDPLFTPGDDWNTLSPRYITVRRLSSLVTNVIVWGIAVAASAIFLQRPEITVPIAVVGLAWTVWRFIRARRWVQSWRWTERDSDLCIVRGLWSRTLTVIPFGRMQMVEVSAGPLMRWQGLADVQLVTAAAHSNAHIYGLAREDAVALRDRMIELSDARGAGL